MAEWFFIVMIYLGQTLQYTYASDIDYDTQAQCEEAADNHGSFKFITMAHQEGVVVEWNCYQKGEMVP